LQSEIAGLKDQDVANREVAIEVVLLRSEADQRARRLPIGLGIVPEDPDRAGRLFREADDRVYRGGLSGTVRAKKSEKLTCFDSERNTIDGGKVAVSFYQVRDFNRGFYGTNPFKRL
jgi:hypothetical protein